MRSAIFIKKSIAMLILILALKTSMSLKLNDSFYLNENETYYELSNDLAINAVITINLSNIIIDGKSHYFIGAFNATSQNVTFLNINFKSYNSFISAHNSAINILGCGFQESQNAITLVNSNFSLINNSFISINNLLSISADEFSANISQNRFEKINNSAIVLSSSAIDGKKINLNNNQSDFYGLFKILGADSSHYFNGKQFFIHNNIVYEAAGSYNELSGLLSKKSKNIAISSNITLTKILSLTNDVNFYGRNNYFISNISREYSIVLIGGINFSMESLNIISTSKIALSNMGANAAISSCSLFSKDTGYYQLDGSLSISDSYFYFSNESGEKTGMRIESGQANLSNTVFINAKSGVIALSDSIINGITPRCSNHPFYKLMLANLESAFSKESIIIASKSFIYGKDYDYYNGITAYNPEQNSLCSYPGFLLNGKYPWEADYEKVLDELKNLIGFKSQNPDSALGDLNFISSYENYSIKYSSKNPELLADNGKVANPFLTPKTAALMINISKDDLWIDYLINIVILPIMPINSSRVISSGEFQSNELVIENNFETDSNNSIISSRAAESIKIIAPKQGMSLILKKGNELLFNSSIDNYSELLLDMPGEAGAMPQITSQYDFYWIANNSVYSIERLNVKIINNVLLKSGNIMQEYYDNVRQIILDYYSDYEKGIIDFSNSITDNILSLSEELRVERNLGNIVSIIIPKQVYSINDWDGLFLMPTLLRDYSFENESAAFAFKIGNENIDLYSSEEFIITISGFCGFNAGFENQTGAYAMSKNDYFDNGTDLVLKTNHLSTFFVYQEKPAIIEQSEEIILQNDDIIQEEDNTQLTTGLISILSINQKDSLNFLRAIFCILMFLAILFVLKKNFLY